MGVGLRSWDQMAKWGMAHEKFSLSEESTHEQIQGENHDYYCFFSSHAIVHKEFVPPGQTVNHAFYKDNLERLRKLVQQVWRDIADDWLLHHHNAPSHSALSIWEFLIKENIPLLPHPPYSPDLALCNFYLFPSLTSKLKGHHFGTVEKIQKIVNDELNTLTENDFQYCYDQWKNRNHCVSSQGS